MEKRVLTTSQRAALNNKVAMAIRMLQDGERLALRMSPSTGYWVAFSGGKDSQVAYDLVKRACVKHAAFYSVTGNDAPESLYFMRENYPEVKWIHPKRKFFALVKSYGLPLCQRRFCCERLKERVGMGHTVVLGIRAQESAKRAKYGEVQIKSRRIEHKGKPKSRDAQWLGMVEHQCIKGQDVVQVFPVYHFTEREIWDYIYENGLPINPVYQKYGRVGCMFCPLANPDQVRAYGEANPGFKRAFLRAIDANLQSWEGNVYRNAEEAYAHWLSKKPLEEFRKELS